MIAEPATRIRGQASDHVQRCPDQRHGDDGHTEILEAIRTSKDLSDDTGKKLKDATDAFAKSFA